MIVSRVCLSVRHISNPFDSSWGVVVGDEGIEQGQGAQRGRDRGNAQSLQGMLSSPLPSYQDLTVRRQLAREVLELTASHIRPGITTDELDKICHDACVARDSYPSPLNYRNFPKSVCT